MSCDDPGAPIGQQLALPILQERLDARARDYAAQRAAAAEEAIIKEEVGTVPSLWAWKNKTLHAIDPTVSCLRVPEILHMGLLCACFQCVASLRMSCRMLPLTCKCSC